MTKEENTKILRKMGYYIKRNMTEEALEVAGSLHDWAVGLTVSFPKYAPAYVLPSKYKRNFQFDFKIDNNPDSPLYSYVWLFEVTVYEDGKADVYLIGDLPQQIFSFDPHNESINEFISRITPSIDLKIQDSMTEYINESSVYKCRLKELGHNTIPSVLSEEEMCIAVKLHELALEIATDDECNIEQAVTAESCEISLEIAHYIGYSEEEKMWDTVLYRIVKDYGDDEFRIILGDMPHSTLKFPSQTYNPLTDGDIDDFVNRLRIALKGYRLAFCRSELSVRLFS